MKKTFSIIEYYRGIELQILCVTTSKKKFAQLSGISLNHINSHAHSYDLRYSICNENPDKVYAKPGMGGEGNYIFNREEVKTLEEYKELINLHREKYPTKYDYYEHNK